MTRGARVTVALAISAIFGLGSSALTFARGPSTPKERKRALEYVRALEANPLDEESGKKAHWLTVWLDEVPDITVTVCVNAIGPILSSDKPGAKAMSLQMMFSSAGYLLEHLEGPNDDVDVFLAGLEGALKVYDVFRAKVPDSRSDFADDLLEKRARGELRAYIKERCLK